MKRPGRVPGSVLALASIACVASLICATVSRAQVYLEPGGEAVVSGVGNLGLSVREGPGFRFPKLAVIPEGTRVIVKDGPTLSGGMSWYLIGGSTGEEAEGWSDGEFLQPVQGERSEESDSASEGRTPSARGAERAGKSFVGIVTGYALEGRTALGTAARWGVVAVDPSVIPLGSKIQIDGFEDTFVAEDTGGGVRGNWIDIWFPSRAEASRFGVQSRRVTIVEP